MRASVADIARWAFLTFVATVALVACGGEVAPTVPHTPVTFTPTPTSAALTWVGAAMPPAAILLGDGNVSSSPEAGYVFSCTTNFRGGGAQHAGPWIDFDAGTWDAESKIAVQGSVAWPSAANSFGVQGEMRLVMTNGLPDGYSTGTFPITDTDPAYQFDRNPNAIQTQSFTYRLPATPQAAGTPSCVGLGPIGVMSDGVILFNALDDAGRDAAAHEVQDSCDGHPQARGIYHYHDVPSCLLAQATGTSTLVGYALDGFGIYVERDANGNLPTNADLDQCHGRTSVVNWDGAPTVIYHYSATLEYPYTLGCFRGSPVG